MKEQFQKAKAFPYQQGVSIEGFSMGTSTSIHYFLNTFGSIKMQKDASNYLALELLGEK